MGDVAQDKKPTVGNGRPVLFVAPQPFFIPTGTPINVLSMCRALCEEGYQVHLLTLPLGSHIELENLVYHRVSAIPFVRRVPVGFSVAKGMYDLLVAAGLVAMLFRQRFLAVHALEESAFFAVPIARWFRTPVIVDLDSDLSQQLLDQPSRLGRWLAKPAAVLRRHALRRAHWAVTVAPYLTALVRRESPGTKVIEIPDTPLDAALRQPDPAEGEKLRQELKLPAEAPILVYTGNFGHRQGLHLLIEAMREICAEYPSCRLLLVGGELPEIEDLRRLAEKHAVTEAVVFAGRRPPELMPEVMALASVLLSPRVEPNVTPLKIYSYMASGRPIVATDLPTHNTVVDGDCAVLVPPSAEGLARGISSILREPEMGERLGARARERVHDRYSFATFKQRMLELYASLDGG
jgi:glycosyltransferase involved in cell wall biosynthesis